MTHDRTAGSVEVFFAKTTDGKWVTATCSSPYFYIEANSEVEARTYAAEATRLYFENRDKVRPESSLDKGQAKHYPPSLTEVTSELLYA